MIDRYTLPEFKELWSDQTKFQTQWKVEFKVLEAMEEYGDIPFGVCDRIKSSEHFDKLLDVKRIYELEGTPDTVARNSLPEQTADLFEGLMQDRQAEIGAIIKYNVAIATAVASGDNATRDILAGILADEDDHLLDIERRLVQISQVTRPQWLSLQIG